MPESRRAGLVDITHATSATGTVPISAGAGALPSWTKNAGGLTVQPGGATASIDFATLHGYAKNCQHYGADPTGVASSTAAIQAASDAGGVGGTIYLPPGTYKTTGSIILQSNQVVCGSGHGKTTLKAASDHSTFFVTTGLSRVVIRDMFLDGNGLLSGPAIQLMSGASDCLVEGCRMTGANWGILITGVDAFGRHTIAHNIISDTIAANGIEINGSHGNLILGNTITLTLAFGSNPNNAIETFPPPGVPLRGNRIIGNYLSSLRNSGIFSAGDEGLVIANNWIDGCKQSGIAIVADATGATPIKGRLGIISGNYVRNCGTATSDHGIAIAGGSDGAPNYDVYGYTVSGNTVTGSGNAGIIATYCSAMTIVGNVCSGNTQQGIYIYGTKNSTISANTCFDNAHGIQSSSTDCVFANNICTNVRTTTQYHGIFLFFSTRANVLGNNVLGNFGDGINNSFPTNNKIRNNQGWVTENDGVATVVSGQTSVSVAHGLAIAPAIKDIHVTPTNLPTNNVRWYVSAADATNITITLSGDPGASGATFAWNAFIF